MLVGMLSGASSSTIDGKLGNFYGVSTGFLVNFNGRRGITAPERWIQYDSFREKLDVLNLPEDILPKLSTMQLAEGCAPF